MLGRWLPLLVIIIIFIANGAFSPQSCSHLSKIGINICITISTRTCMALNGNVSMSISIATSFSSMSSISNAADQHSRVSMSAGISVIMKI